MYGLMSFAICLPSCNQGTADRERRFCVPQKVSLSSAHAPSVPQATSNLLAATMHFYSWRFPEFYMNGIVQYVLFGWLPSLGIRHLRGIHVVIWVFLFTTE